MVQPSKENSIVRGSGPEKAVCLLASACGLGDDLHAMPIIWQMIRDGYEVTVYAKSFQKELWKAVGAEVLDIPVGGFLPDFDERNKTFYSRIITLSSWSTWQVPTYHGLGMDTMDYFAYLLDAKVPPMFSWVDILAPKFGFHGDPYIIFAPESGEVWRTIPDDQCRRIMRALSKGHKVVWLTHGRRAATEQQVDELAKRLRLYHKQRNVMLAFKHEEGLSEEALEAQIEAMCEVARAESARLANRTRCENLRELIDLVWNAERIISTENGISNLAGALGCPLTVICGPTEPTHILGQYKRFMPDWSYETVLGTQPNNGICKLPCWRREDRGMLFPKDAESELCCGYSGNSLCLSQIDTGPIMRTLEDAHANA